jgi:hypothetical protein
MYKNFDTIVNAVGAHTYEGIKKQMEDNSWTLPTRIDSMVR